MLHLKCTYIIRNSSSFGLYYGKYFSSKFKKDILLLELNNPHPNDEKLSFDISDHSYYHNDVKVKTSVTEIVDNFFEKFSADLAIQKMTNRSNWPTIQYQHANGNAYSIDEIKAMWEKVGEEARNEGTLLHLNIERFFNRVEHDESPEFRQFLNFYGDFMQSNFIKPFRTEWKIILPQHNIAGSVDFVGVLPDGRFIIIDWKRSKNLFSKNLHNSYGKYARFPIHRIKDCLASKYFLQLNMYRYILKESYGLDVAAMLLVGLFGDSPPLQIDVPLMEAEVLAMLQTARSSPKQKAQSSQRMSV